mgnify:CR=1 FL=1
MKHARKLTSLLLALVMVFALAVTVAADGTTGTTGTGSITVDNPQNGTTYTAYKIFDVVYDEATPKHYSYTIEGGSEWFSTVETYAKTEGSGLTLTLVNGTTTYVVTTTGAFSAPPFADALKAAVNGKTGKTLAVADGKATATDLDLGYYFVTSTTDALCNLTTTNPAVIIHDKNEMPFEKKDDKVSAEVGETVNYTIKGKVPDHTGFTKYTYLVTDTMSEGLTFKKDVKVTVDGADVTNACTCIYDVENNANKFTVSIPVRDYTIGHEILVTYTALVNENAVAKISKNSATLTYSNNPSDSTKTDTTTTVEETVYSSKIVIDKFETGKQETVKLPGAKFVLYKKAPTETDQNAIQYYKKWADTDTTKAVTWVDSITDATEVTTNDNGAASFDGLADGTYYLVETKAPAGYNQLTAPVAVPVNDGTTETALTVTANVANQAGTLLPSTGGMGTTIFYVLGFVLVVGAGVLLVTKKRMSQSEI